MGVPYRCSAWDIQHGIHDILMSVEGVPDWLDSGVSISRLGLMAFERNCLASRAFSIPRARQFNLRKSYLI